MKLPLYILKILLSAFCVILIPIVFSSADSETSEFIKPSNKINAAQNTSPNQPFVKNNIIAAKAAAAATATKINAAQNTSLNHPIIAKHIRDAKAVAAATATKVTAAKKECTIPTNMPVVDQRCDDDFAKMARNKCMNTHEFTKLGIQTTGMVVQAGAISSGKSNSAAKASKAVGTTNLVLGGLNTKVAVSCLKATSKCKKICSKKIKECTTKMKSNPAPNNKDRATYQSALKVAKNTRATCETLSEKGIAAAAQAILNATQAGLGFAAAKALSPDDNEPPPPNTNIAPPQVPNFGNSGFNHSPNPYSGVSPSTTNGANLVGNSDDTPSPSPSPSPNSKDKYNNGFRTNLFENYDDTPSPNSKDKYNNGSAPSSGLDSNTTDISDPNETTDNNDNGLLRKNSFIGKFTGGRSSSNGSNYNNEDSSFRRGGRLKLSQLSKETISNSKNLKRRLSSSSGKHKSIFEHMSTLITSYCIEGSTNCH